MVSLVHGLGEHRGRFVDFAVRLNQVDFAVTAIDLRGHGQSRGLVGIFLRSMLTLRSAVAEQKLKDALSKVAGSILPGVSIPSGLDFERVSRDPEVVQKLRKDPL